MTEPTTAAGRAWMETLAAQVVTGTRDAILAIEAEARAAALDEARAAVQKLMGVDITGRTQTPPAHFVLRHAVIDAIAALRERQEAER